VQEFPNRNRSLSFLADLMRKITQTGTVYNKPGSGSGFKTYTAQNADAAE